MNRKKKPEFSTLWILFRTCFVISSVCVGGMVIMSMLQKKFVEEYKWIEEDEMMDLIAIAQSCPGVMGVNTAIIIGYRMAGPFGAIATLLGTITPPMILLSVISVFYTQFRENTIIALILRGMQAGVSAVLISTTIKMGGTVLKTRELLPILMLVSASIGIAFFGVDIICVLLLCGSIGGCSAYLQSKHRKEEAS